MKRSCNHRRISNMNGTGRMSTLKVILITILFSKGKTYFDSSCLMLMKIVTTNLVRSTFMSVVIDRGEVARGMRTVVYVLEVESY